MGQPRVSFKRVERLRHIWTKRAPVFNARLFTDLRVPAELSRVEGSPAVCANQSACKSAPVWRFSSKYEIVGYRLNLTITIIIAIIAIVIYNIIHYCGTQRYLLMNMAICSEQVNQGPVSQPLKTPRTAPKKIEQYSLQTSSYWRSPITITKKSTWKNIKKSTQLLIKLPNCVINKVNFEKRVHFC